VHKENTTVISKKELIFSTMLKLIAERGIHNTPMSLIAKESGVATGTIYHYYKSKNEILNDLYLEKKKVFGLVIAESLKIGETKKEKFISLWSSIYEYYTSNPLTFLFIEQVIRSPIIDPETKEKAAIYYQEGFDFILDGIKEGNFINMDATVMMPMIHGNIISMTQMALENIEKVNEEMIQQAIILSWRAIKK